MSSGNIIQITSNWRIKVQSKSLALEEYRFVKARQNREEHHAWVRCGYYSSLSSAIAAVPTHIALHGDFENLKQLLDQIGHYALVLEAKLKSLDGEAAYRIQSITDRVTETLNQDFGTRL